MGMGEAAPKEFDRVIADYYERAPEEDRLEQGPFQLEEVRTRELIQRFAPLPPGVVVDIGGAAGAYALWLAEAGYSVHLLDRAPRLVAEARRRSGAAVRPLLSCRVVDARALDVPAEIADVVLLLGPLYHLTDSGDRARALREAARVLKPGGRLFAAAISRWASAFDGLARDLIQDPRSWSRICGTVSTAIRRSGWITSRRRTSITRRSWPPRCWRRASRSKECTA
jgi:SAM-dependent methyltransferase